METASNLCLRALVPSSLCCVPTSLAHFWTHRQTHVDRHEVCVCLADRTGVWQPLMGLCVPHSLISEYLWMQMLL